MNNPGRTMLLFFGLTVVVLLSGLAISIYLLQNETNTRKSAEVQIEELNVKTRGLEASLTDAKKQVDVLAGKNKDADEKINGLLDDLEIEKGLREEVKKENQKLKDDLEIEAKAKVELRNKLTKDLDDAQSRLKELETGALTHKDEVDTLQKKLDELAGKNSELEKKLKEVNDGISARQARTEIVPIPGTTAEEKVELDRIVVTSVGSSPAAATAAPREARVLSVDTDTEFLIFDQGSNNGIRAGDVMSVARGKQYLGDVRVSRVQEEMAAADFIPPFNSRKVRKNDLVTPKK